MSAHEVVLREARPWLANVAEFVAGGPDEEAIVAVLARVDHALSLATMITAPLTEEGRQLPMRVLDRSWLHRGIGNPAPPEYEEALWTLDHTVRLALACDWSPEEIVREVQQLVRSYGPQERIAGPGT